MSKVMELRTKTQKTVFSSRFIKLQTKLLESHMKHALLLIILIPSLHIHQLEQHKHGNTLAMPHASALGFLIVMLLTKLLPEKYLRSRNASQRSIHKRKRTCSIGAYKQMSICSVYVSIYRHPLPCEPVLQGQVLPTSLTPKSTGYTNGNFRYLSEPFILLGFVLRHIS